MIGLQANVLDASTSRELDTAFASLARERADALFVGPDPLFLVHRDKLVALAARHAVPAIYGDREIAEAGYRDAAPLVAGWKARVFDSGLAPD